MSKDLNAMKEIKEDAFFDLKHPDNPCVEIQFKIGAAKNPRTTNDIWTPIEIMDNHFDNITITDVSGFQTLELYLKDRDFINIENVILKTLMYARVSSWENFYNKDTLEKIQGTSISGGKKATDGQAGDKQTADALMRKQFQFFIDNESAECIRVRFGHSLVPSDMPVSNFKGRTKKETGTVIMTDWIYFILLNVNYNVDSNGSMSFLIKGISASQAYLERAKLMVNGTTLEGTAKEIWHMLKTYIEQGTNWHILLQEDSNGGGEDQYFKMPQDFFQYQGNKKLTLNSLYEQVQTVITEQGVERVISFKSLKQLLDDFVNLLKPIYRTKNGQPVPRPEETPNSTTKEAEYEIHHIEKPTWFARKLTGEMGEYIAIGLYYASPMSDNNHQKIKRVYTWKDAPNSLIRNFSVSTDNDFAMLNAPVCLKNKNGKTEIVNFKSVYSGKESFNNKINYIKALKEGLSSNFNNNIDGFVVAEAFDIENNNTVESFIDSFVNNINNSVFKGEVEIPLDPFYLFDDEMLPYVYTIKIDVNRPTRFDQDNNIKIPNKSYLSGNYLISKIVHNISHGSATTKLSVIKFPDVSSDYDDSQAERPTREQQEENTKKLLEAEQYKIKELKAKEIELSNNFTIKDKAINDAINGKASGDDVSIKKLIQDKDEIYYQLVEIREELNRTITRAYNYISED